MNRFLLFAALFLAGQAQAYVILESKYRVEIKPGVFQDQLVLKCDNGRKLTVPWEARLSEACGEVEIPRGAAAAAADEAQERQAAQDRPVAQGNQTSQQRQKEILMSRVREQYGNVDEKHVTVPSGVAGAEPHFSPQMREILKRYELCRKSSKGSPTCAAERNQAMAALSAQPGSGEAAPGTNGAVEMPPAAKPKAAPAKHKQAAAKPAPKAEPIAVEPIDAAPPAKPDGEPMHTAAPAATPAAAQVPTAAQAPAAAQAPTAAQSKAEPEAMPAGVAAATTPDAGPSADRTTREQKITADYALCMRAKPKFECETARAAALKALDAPGKPKAKSKAAAKSTQSPDVATN